MYICSRPARSESVSIRNLRYHVLRWGNSPAGAAAPTLVLLHGWMDVAASWQFLVDAFSDDFACGRTIVAPDWRGFGLTASGGSDHYGFPDYLADLDFLLDHYAGGEPVDLVAHSMGGNAAMLYAGVRPQRVRRLVNLEGFGMPGTQPEEAPQRYARWMDELKALYRGELALKPYDSIEAVARRMIKTNPRLGADKAHWLARHWAQEMRDENGQAQWNILGDAAHKVVNAQLYHVDEVLATWRNITAPVLAVECDNAHDSLMQWFQSRYPLDEYHRRLRSVANHQIAVIEHAGHMLHHDQPHALARLIEPFLATSVT